MDTGELIDQARRLQAAEYVRHGYHTADSVDADGFLVASIDPTGVVARSRYLGILDGDGQVGACIRMIDAVADELSTLPTIEKIEHSTPGGSVPALSLFHAGSVFEVSGLARSSRCPDPSVTTRLLLAVVSEARRRGDDFAVMGLVEPIATVLLNAYGRQAIRPLELPSIRVSGVGIRPAGLTLVPCSTRAVTFVDDIMTHLKTRPVSRFGRQTLELCEMTADAFAQAYGIHTPAPAGPPGDPIGCSPLTPS